MLVGTDITVISRFDKMVEKFGDKAYKRFLNDEEIELVKSTATAAGFWAVKEAFSKALGCGIGSELGFHDISIKKTDKNQPYLQINDEIINKFNIKNTSISIAHDGGFAIAIVVVL
ncbi:MAG: holo-ACP synthase [Arcobacteraceae bacterium]|jgi:holo-[acyl-carrier protein] synthase|nr:holo-ACP synthase [Arcobacteraceae bacterium]MDY0328131.1 holo-ACP synthase [Arcobacteraceae bacterium]